MLYGKCHVGNSTASEAHKWLVGVSYRIITWKDPVPSAERGNVVDHLLIRYNRGIYQVRPSIALHG